MSFIPVSQREHEKGNRGIDVADYCQNCERPFMQHSNGVCPRDRVLSYAKVAVANEYKNPFHGRLAHYDNQAVLDDVLNHFDFLTSDDDEDFIHEMVREAEAWFNEANGCEL
jgi:hypothetical protein